MSALAEQYEKDFDYQPTENPKWFELACIIRYLYLFEYMEANALKEVVQCDTDVMVFQDLEADGKWIRNHDYTLSTDVGGSANCRSSYLTFDVVSSLKQFMLDRHGKESNDMDLWNDFRRTHPYFKCGEMNQIRDGSIYDRSMGWDDTSPFESDPSSVNGPSQPIKKVYWIKGIPHFKAIGSGQMVRAKTLHCWGNARAKMSEFLEISKSSL